MNERLLLATFIWLLAPLPAASADDSDATTATEAAMHSKKGPNAYRAGDLDEAVMELKAAVKLKPTPNGIFALGQALREKGDLVAAAHQYRQYLTLAPDGPFADKSETFLANIEATQTSLRHAQTAPPQGVPAEISPALTRPRADTAGVETERFTTPSAPPTATARGAPTPRPVYKRWWLWTTVGVVAAGVAVGLGAGLGTQPHTRTSDAQVKF